MRIAFHAPLKPPDHAVPSGDRTMARLIMRALAHAGHEVSLASRMRTWRAEPEAPDPPELEGERTRIARDWERGGAPDLWFSYHPYYKAPDLLGPGLCQRFRVPIVTAEASYAGKRDADGWAAHQAEALRAIAMARVNISFTSRDAEGLSAVVPPERIARLDPFIDIAPFRELETKESPDRLVAVAMMRAGEKFESYRFLADALSRLRDRPWLLTAIGGGPMEAEVRSLFDPARTEWLGEVPAEKVPERLAGGGIYVWPGVGEAYGLAYLEAQAAGLPVVAQETAGIPAVVLHESTGLLTPEGDTAAYAAAIASLLSDPDRRRVMGNAARRYVLAERSLEVASRRFAAILAAIK